MSALAIYQQLTRCETLTPYAETSLPRQRTLVFICSVRVAVVDLMSHSTNRR